MSEKNTKAVRREKKKRPRMKISGKEVFKLQKLKARNNKKIARNFGSKKATKKAQKN